MDDSVRLVTQLEILCEALQPNLIMLIMDIQSCHPKVGLTPQELRRWWALKNAPYPANAAVLTAYFGVASIEELGLGVTRRAARHRAHLNPEELRKEVFDRRRILKTMAAAGGVAAAAGLRVPVSDLIATGQLLDGYRKIGDVEVEHARGAATDLAIAYAAAPNAEARGAAEAHAYSLLDLLRPGAVQMSDETRRSLLSVASDAAALAGYGQLDAGRFDKAKRWFDKALELAEEAGDLRLQALAHAAFAAIAMRTPEPNHAASVAALQAAAAFQRCLPPVARAGVFGSLGCEIAATGDDLVSGRFLEQALHSAALISYDEPGWGWWSIHGDFNGWDGPHRPEVYTAGRAMWLGRPGDAVAVFDAAVARSADPRERAGLSRHLVNSCVALGDPDRACAYAHGALDEAKAYELATIPPRIHVARLSFPREWNSLAVVRELDERLALVA